MLFLPLLILHDSKAENVRQQHYTLIKGKRMSGQVIDTSTINTAFECGAMCLKKACKAYNIVTMADNTLCEIIGDQMQQNATDNPQADSYCE